MLLPKTERKFLLTKMLKRLLKQKIPIIVIKFRIANRVEEKQICITAKKATIIKYSLNQKNIFFGIENSNISKTKTGG